FLAFGETRIIVADVKWAKHILSTNARAYCRGKFGGGDMLRIVVGNKSLLVTSGELHHRLRRVATPAFKPSVLRSFLPIMQMCTERLAKQWALKCAESEDKNAEIFIKQSLSALTLDIIG